MAYRRTAIRQFSIANSAYRNAVLTFYKVNSETQQASTLLATVYKNPTGGEVAANPYTLDAHGKFVTPLYVEEPIIISVGQSSVGSHSTGIIYPDTGTWKGTWTTDEDYLPGEFVKDGAAGANTQNIYVCLVQHNSGVWADDLSAERWELAIEASTVDLSTATGILPVTAGGTGNSSAAGARTALGLAIGSDVQGYSSVLQSIVAGTYTGGTSINTLGTIGTGAWQGSAIADAYIASAATWNAKLSATTALTALSSLSFVADSLIYGTGTGTVGLSTITSFGRSLVDDANAAAALTTLGVSAFIQTLVDDANASTARTTLGLAIGTDVQAYNANTAIGQSSSVANELALFGDTGGKNLTRATGTGYVKVTAGVYGTTPTVPLTDLAAQAALTVVANATGSSAAPTAVAMTAGQLFGCNSGGTALSGITLGTGLSMSGTTLTGTGKNYQTETTYATNGTLSTTIPADDTIPQNTEGTQIMSITHTPNNASSKISLKWWFFGACAASGDYAIAALFKDSTANALTACETIFYSNGHPWFLSGSYSETAGSTTSREYKLRVGSNGSALYANGVGAASRHFGGVGACRMILDETPP